MLEINKIILGDCIEEMKKLPENSIDAVITDPPYGLEFMGKVWDKFKEGHNIAGGDTGKDTPYARSKPTPAFYQLKNQDMINFQEFTYSWAKECLRVLKPGGYLLSFGGTRTYHRMTCGIEDAGFEIRDCIMWIYGCLSEDTEVLTNFGWLKWEHIRKTIKYINDRLFILVYDNQKNIFKWEKPERWQYYNINKDTCYRIKSNNTDQLVSRNHNCLVEREGKLIFKKAEELSEVEYMPTLSNDFLGLQKRQTKILFQKMQRILQRIRMEEVGKDRGRNRKSTREQNKKRKQRRKESSMERWGNLLQEERKLWKIQNKICPMSKRVYIYGEKGWICNGAQIDNGEKTKSMSTKNRNNSSYRPQSREQSYREFNVIQDKQRTQNLRGIRIDKTKITNQEYSGIVFCPTVSTGCFVARRKNKIFITGNSGFPKSLNIGKQIDKMQGNESPFIAKDKNWGKKENADVPIKLQDKEWIVDKGNSEWEGWGTALKPAWESICMARKPLSEKNVALNVLKWGTGGINIDESRIPFENTKDPATNPKYRVEAGYKINHGDKIFEGHFKRGGKDTLTSGRFPANIIFECICDELIEGKASGSQGHWSKTKTTGFGEFGKGKSEYFGVGEKDDMKCLIHTNPNCPCYILDEQSGISKSKSQMMPLPDGPFSGLQNKSQNIGVSSNGGHSDKGGASRFFYCPKASKSERNFGLDEIEGRQANLGDSKICSICNISQRHAYEEQNKNVCEHKWIEPKKHNFHPTVKPIKLMEYLIKLVTKENGIVLDPFLGSGTTAIACIKANRKFIGIEKEEDYVKIANTRIKPYLEQIKL